MRIAQENSGTSSNIENKYKQGSIPIEAKNDRRNQPDQLHSVKPAHPPDSDIQKPSTSGTNIKSDGEEMATVAAFIEIESTIKLNKDPAVWGINDLTRDIIARNGFEQNKTCDFTKSGRMYSDHRRYLPKNIFYRKMKNNEIKERNWLVYSESKGSLFCGPCLAFGSIENRTQFDAEGSMIGRMQKFE